MILGFVTEHDMVYIRLLFHSFKTNTVDSKRENTFNKSINNGLNCPCYKRRKKCFIFSRMLYTSL